ncbi:MAG: sugar phosphate isomerase/epimerase, partial [bacterium]|nr:sugar phosphate isomerase/epimerase [bacterium]
MRLGAMLPNMPEDPVEMAKTYRRLGYSAAVCPGRVSLADMDYLRAVRDAFAREDILIAEAGAWRNLVPLDAEKRRQAFDFVCERLAVADEIGALCCVDFIGTLDPDSAYGPHPDNLDQPGFDATVETCRRILDAVKPRRARFCLEMMQWLLPDNPDVYREIIHAVDHPMFAAHLDPVNLVVSPRIYFDTG